jgi:hypothetical protein
MMNDELMMNDEWGMTKENRFQYPLTSAKCDGLKRGRSIIPILFKVPFRGLGSVEDEPKRIDYRLTKYVSLFLGPTIDYEAEQASDSIFGHLYIGDILHILCLSDRIHTQYSR